MPRLTLKSSTIFIATGAKTRVFRSVDEVPPPLRKRLKESTSGINSATILIADRRGREEIVRAIRGWPSEMKARLEGSPVPAETRSAQRGRRRELWRNWAELVLLPGVLGVVTWLLFSIK